MVKILLLAILCMLLMVSVQANMDGFDCVGAIADLYFDVDHENVGPTVDCDYLSEKTSDETREMVDCDYHTAVLEYMETTIRMGKDEL